MQGITNEYDLLLDELAIKMQELRDTANNTAINNTKRKQASKDFKEARILYDKYEILAKESNVRNENEILNARDENGDIAHIDTESDAKIREMNRKIRREKYATEKQLNSIIRFKKEIMRDSKRIRKAEMKIEKIQSIASENSDSLTAMADAFYLDDYNNLGKKLTLGVVGTGSITGAALLLMPPLFIPCAVVSGCMAILKLGHVSSKIVKDSGGGDIYLGANVIARDIVGLIPMAKGAIGDMAQKRLESKREYHVG